VKVTVVLPFYDEEALLPSLPGRIGAVREALRGHDVSILAVDDGSRDGTAAGLRRIGGIRTVSHERNRGVGAAMETGMLQGSGDAAIVYDPDGAYEPASLPPLLDALEAGADVATLSPYHPLGGVEGVSRFRLLLSRAASFLYRRRLRVPLHTFTCAVRAYRLPKCRALLPCPPDFTAAAWLLAKALGLGYRVAEVPAVLRARGAGSSKMRILRTLRAHLRLLRDLPVTAGPFRKEP
jgi:dolichol-phosphate mannosyltransferase